MRTSALVMRRALLLAAIALVGGCTSASEATSARSAPSTASAASTAGASTTVESGARRVFRTGFESLTDFAGMYVSPQTASTRHALVAEPRHSGRLAHCAWLDGPGT